MNTALRWTSTDLEVMADSVPSLFTARRATLRASDTLTSPLLPGFKCEVKSIFDSYTNVGKQAEDNGAKG
jgi:hypothetical protein